MTTPTNGAGRPVAHATPHRPDGPTCDPCGTLMVRYGDGHKCLNCEATEDPHRRLMARAVGLSPEEPWEVIAARAQRTRDEHKKLTEAAAAFDACLKGLPSHVAVRPVCTSLGCDLLPKKNGLCNRCYEQKEGG